MDEQKRIDKRIDKEYSWFWMKAIGSIGGAFIVVATVFFTAMIYLLDDRIESIRSEITAGNERLELKIDNLRSELEIKIDNIKNELDNLSNEVSETNRRYDDLSVRVNENSVNIAKQK